jgi:O-antigen/teichoic acid export membrane protein
MFSTLFFGLGIQSNLYFFYPAATQQKRKILVFQTLVLLIILSILTISFLYFSYFRKILIGSGELNNYTPFIMIAIFLLMPINIIEPLYVLRKDIRTSIFYPPAEVILRVFLVIICLFFRPGIKSVLTGVIISTFICLIFVLIYIFKEAAVKNSGNQLINFKVAKEQLAFSLPFGLAVSLNTLSQRFDKIICISYLTSSAFATYSIAFYGIPGIQQVYESLSQVYLIKMTEKHNEGKLLDILSIYKSFVAKTYSFTLPAIMIASLYSQKIIILIFTDKYMDAVPLFRVYLFSFLFFMLGAGLILRATGRTKKTLKSYLYASIITIPATFFLVKYFNTWGAMGGALFSMILPRIGMLLMEIKIMECDIIEFFPWRKFAIILLISSLSIIPFIFLEYLFTYSIIMTVILGLLFLLIVSALEMNFGVFVLESSVIKEKVTNIAMKFGFQNGYKK